jgi:Zn-dependent M28 family amino/carboxypeptidase
MMARFGLAGVLAAFLVFGAQAQAAPIPGSGPIDPAQMSATVKVLASDAFEGRAPGTQGETRTVKYLIERFHGLGLEPGGDHAGWTQAVPLVHTQVGLATTLEVTGLGAPIPLRQGEDIYLNTPRPVDRLTVKDAPLVFVGYGAFAPERDWDDFKGVDLHGKIAVFLVNDPDFEALPTDPVFGKFGGKAMTYYGRWMYKYDEAARRGALGVLVVHETAGAGYPWSTVIAPQGESYDVVRAANDLQPTLLQGWMAKPAAEALFRRAGLDFDALKVAARRYDFHPVSLGAARLDADLPVTHSVVESRNVIAKIEGSTWPDQTVIYGAHWDAFGVGKPDAAGQTVRHGANDDGLGVAGVLEIARAFKANPKPPERTVVFAIWTAEERGLFGSETYALHPLYPLAKTAANFTIDVMQTAGPSRTVVLVGAGQDSLEGDLAREAQAQGRTVTADTHPERGLFYRADHFSLAKRGVPTLLLMALGGGPDLIDGGQAAGDKWVSDYTANCYHKPCDAWSASWDLRGAAQDVDLIYQAGLKLANSELWPTWNAGSEFKAIRDRSSSQR